MQKDFHIDPNQGILQANGELKIAMTKNEIVNKRITKKIKIALDGSEIVNKDIRSIPYEFSIEFKKNGRKDIHSGEVSFYYPEVISVPSSQQSTIGTINLRSGIQELGTTSSSENWSIKIEGIARNSNGEEVRRYGGGDGNHIYSLFRDAIKNPKLAFRVPEGIRVKVDQDIIYDSSTRLISNLPSSLMLWESGDMYQAGASVDFKHTKPYVKYKIDYDFTNPSQVKGSYQASDIQLSLEYFGKKLEVGDKYTGNLLINQKDIIPVKRIYSGELIQNSKDVELFSLAWTSAQVKLNEGERIPYLNTVMQVDENKVKIKKIIFNQDALSKMTDVNLQFRYTTNLDSAQREANLSSNIELQPNEYITAIYMDSEVYNHLESNYNENTKFVTFYGDVEEQSANEVKYTLAINSNVKNSGLDPVTISKENGELVLLRKEPKMNFFTSFKESKNIIQGDVNSNTIYPGQTSTFTLLMNEKYTQANIKPESVDIRVDVSELNNLKLQGLTNRFDTGNGIRRHVHVEKITYKTNKETNTKVLVNENRDRHFDFKLSDDEYFTELTITTNTNIWYIEGKLDKSQFALSFYIKNPVQNSYEGKDKLTFVVDDNESYKDNKLSYEGFDIKQGIKFSIGTSISGTYPIETNVNVGQEIDYSITARRSESINGIPPSDAPRNVVVNPIYYFKIPRYFSYVKDSISVNNKQKQPRVEVLSSESKDYYYVKVEFYGDPDSATGLRADSVKMNFKVKIEPYAPRYSYYGYIEAYEDASNSIEVYKAFADKHEWMDLSIPTKSIKVFDNDITVLNSMNLIYKDLNILHEPITLILGNVNTNKDALLKQHAEIKSGEEFNAFFDIINNSTGLEDYTMYIPVPKSNRDDGDGPYAWDARLQSAIGITNPAVTIQYSTKEAPTMMKYKNGTEDANGMYVNAASIDDFSKVTMIKINISKIKSGETISLSAKLSDLIAKTDKGDKVTEVRTYYTYKIQGSSTYFTNKSDKVSITLQDSVISGYLFDDKNENGLKDSSDGVFSNKKVTLYDSDGKEVMTTKSNTDGFYTMTVSAIPKGGYLMVEKMDRYSLTTYKKPGNPATSISSFDPDTKKAYPDVYNSETLNAGYILTPDVIADKNPITLRVNKSDKILYHLDPIDATKDIIFESADPKIATVNDDGTVTGVSTGKTFIKVYYISSVGTKIFADVEVIVESNDAPVINAPEEITMNVGDEWNPLDTTIIEGLSLSDDHDNVTIDDLSVIDTDLPIGDKFLFFFNTANTGKLTKAGTYEITYYYEDVDKNKTMKKVKVKINGQPYMTDADGNKLDNLPTLYYRIGTSLNQFDGIKAFWEKASDEIGEPPIVTEILPEDPNTGVFTLVESVDKDGNKVIGDPSEVGKYTGTFHVITPSTAKSIASISPKRELYARSQIQMSIHSIAYSSTATQKKFNDWNEFYNKFKDSLEITASVNTPDKDGNSITIDLFNNDSHNIKAITDISKLDFSLPDGMKSIDIPIEVEVSDSGKDSSLNADYGELKHRYTFHVTVQDVVGEAPHIHFKDIERIETDAIKKEATEDSPDLSSDDAMKEAADKGEHPIYDKLITDLTLSDKETPADQIKVEILSIKRTSTPRNQSLKIEYDPNNEYDLRDMMKTIGTYEIVYQAIDGNENRVTATRVVKVAGKTIFVKDLSTFDPYDDVVTLMQRDHPYIPDGVFAYHMEYDEIGKDATVVHPMVASVDISNPGTYEVSYYTTHHFGTYPMSDIKRPNDTVNQTIKVHGNVKFNEQENAIKEDFVGQTVDLNEIEATYLKASDTVGEVPVETKLTLTNDINTSSYTANNPEEKSVTFSVKEGVVSGQLHVLYRFYDTPKITNISDGTRIEVKEDITENEIKDKIAAKASITKYDGNSIDLTNQITYDFSDIKDSKVMIQVEYTLSNGKKAIDKKTVYIDRVKKATITASDIVYNVNDTIDLKKDSNLSINDQSGEVDLNKVKIKGEVPEHMGTASKAGTYKITFSYEDHVGNVAETDILVKVHGLPVISGINDMEKRVGDDFKVWDNIKVTYEKAPDQEGPATLETFTYANANDIGAKLELKDMKDELSGNPVSFDSINTPGYYSGIYYAETPNKAKVELKRTLLLHGQPQISANNITISINVEKPDDFISEFKDELNLKASVIHAYKDKAPEEVDLIKNVTIKSNTIAYGTPGTYKVEFEVQDNSLGEALYANKLYNIDVTVAVIAGHPPTITTPDRHRVENDPIGINDSGRTDVVKYLTEAPIYDETNKNTVKSKDLISVKINGQTELNNPSNDQLLNMLDTVGVHEVKIQVTDSRNNIITVSQYWHVAGATEFGILKEPGNENTFERITDIYNVRQSIGENFHNSGIRARHLDPDGTYHYMPIDQSSDQISLDTVGRHEVTISATHHYAVYEDDANQKRTKDSLTFYLLVQGRIKFSKIDDIYTREGTSVDPLKNANEDGTYIDITATFEMVHKDGTITTENASLSATYVDTSTIGKRTVELTAKEQLSGVNNYAETYQRNVYVYSIPNIDYNPGFNVGKDATLNDLKNGLAAVITYRDDKGNTLPVQAQDIEINYDEVLKEIQGKGPGKSYSITITVSYMDNGQKKQIVKTANVYVLNDPSVIVQIPKYIELKDDGKGDIEASPEVQLYGGDDKDDQKINVPKVNIYVDSSVVLREGTDEFTAQTYKKDNQPYTNPALPILELEYGKLEKDHFYLKADKAAIPKNIGVYQGLLNFTMEYEGD